jgi:hypothetical protein
MNSAAATGLAAAVGRRVGDDGRGGRGEEDPCAGVQDHRHDAPHRWAHGGRHLERGGFGIGGLSSNTPQLVQSQEDQEASADHAERPEQPFAGCERREPERERHHHEEQRSVRAEHHPQPTGKAALRGLGEDQELHRTGGGAQGEPQRERRPMCESSSPGELLEPELVDGAVRVEGQLGCPRTRERPI